LVITRESRDEITVLNILKELFADAPLYILGGFKTLHLKSLQVRRNIHTPDLGTQRGTRLIDPPFCNYAVRIETLVQRGRHAAIKIDVIKPDDDTQFLNIEIGIFRLKRIKRPLDQLYAAAPGLVALCQ